MAEGGAPGPQQQPQQQEQPQPNPLMGMIRMMAMYWMMSSLMGKKKTLPPSESLHNLFAPGQGVDVMVYLSPSADLQVTAEDAFDITKGSPPIGELVCNSAMLADDPLSDGGSASDELDAEDEDEDFERQCSPESSLVVIDYAQSGIDEGSVLVWQQSDVTLDFKETSKRTQSFVLRNLPPRLLTGNESLYAHFYFGRSSAVTQASLAVEMSKMESLAASTNTQQQKMDDSSDEDEFEDLDDENDDWPEGEDGKDDQSSASQNNREFELDAWAVSVNLVKYFPKPKNKATKRLLQGLAGESEDDKDGKKNEEQHQEEEEEEEDDNAVQDIVSFWNPNKTMNVVQDYQVFPKNGQFLPHIESRIQLHEGGNHYYPLLFENDFWILRDYLIQMNDSVTELPLHLEVSTITNYYFQILTQMEQSFKMQESFGSIRDGESDEVKRIFLEGNPILLGVTTVVSLLHTVFEFLAFKNDVSFWKNNKSMEGLSARSILINAFCQIIIFLYLLDNETSWMIILSSGVGVLIELWKITKAFSVTIDRNGPFPFISLKDKAGYTETATKKHDREAITYLSYVLYPLIIGYSAYSLYYDSHKSWYSWILGSLVGFVYTFGFIMMVPQLYINYKLKSVAHLPWRQMTYKFLTTIIDDLFAFIIKMPTMHRLSCFRDDIIFLIFLYQRWVYRVDPTRVNEFGYSQQAQGGEAEKQENDDGAAAITDANGSSAEPDDTSGGADPADSKKDN